MPNVSRNVTVLLVLGAAVLALFPLVGDDFYIRLLAKIMVLAILAMSLDLLVGFTGLVSLGHAAFYGVAGYITGALINYAFVVEIELLLPAALAGAAVLALVIGWISIRTSGIYFIMITLAFGQMVYFFFFDRFWGGADGMNVYEKPRFSIGGMDLIDMSDRVVHYYVTLACMIGVYLLLRTLLKSPFGRVIVGIKVNENRVRALGFAVQRYKLVAFVIAGTIAGLAGFLEIGRAAFIAPEHVGWHESGLVLVIVLLGGMGTLWGPIVGAFVLVLLEDYVSSVTELWLLVMGVFVILMVLFLPQGIAGLLNRALDRLPVRRGEAEALESKEVAADG